MHGSWLNIAETELSVLSRQCLNRRIESFELLESECRSGNVVSESGGVAVQTGKAVFFRSRSEGTYPQKPIC